MITMKTKEKAKELVESFYYKLPNNGSSTGLNSTTSRYEEAIVCALIAVEFAKENPLNTDGYNKYLDELKQEIENI